MRPWNIILYNRDDRLIPAVCPRDSGLHWLQSNQNTSGYRADVAQLVERVLGKDEVTSSILVIGSSFLSEHSNSTRLSVSMTVRVKRQEKV